MIQNNLQKKECYLAIGLDLLIIIFGIIGTVWEIYENGWGMLAYYTVDSNIFVSICCLLDMIFQVKSLKQKTAPVWVKNIKYMATCCMVVTFIVVIFILAPMEGWRGLIKILFEGALLYQHFLCPILAIVSFVCIDSKQICIDRKMLQAALIPTVIYAVISIILNVTKVMHGPYPFLYVYEQPFIMSVLWCILIITLAYVIALGLWKWNQKIKTKSS